MANPLIEKLKKSSWSSIAKETIQELERLESANASLHKENTMMENEIAVLRHEKAELEGKLTRIKGMMP